jgi:hypothetical protein
MSYLRHLCLVAYIGVQHIFCFSSSYVPYVSSFSDCLFVIALWYSLAFIEYGDR